MLELKGIHKYYGQNHVVRDVNLTIGDGEFFSLLGPSGCGKTTILRLVAGFEFPSQGEILLNGKVINNLSPFKRDLHTVFQNYALFPNYTVFDNIAYSLKLKKKPKKEIEQRVEAVLEITGLQGFGPRMPFQLSGGQQQRVALARAIVGEPAVLLLDEPLSALDKKASEMMRLELMRIQKVTGITFIYVTHNQAEALTMSDRIAVMKAGRIEQCDTAVNIYERPATDFTAGFIGDMNFLAGTVVESGDNQCRIKLGDGTIMRRSGRFDLAPGEAVTVGIRPQQFKLTLLEPKSYENGVQGVVTHRTYIGDVTRYYLELETGEPVLVVSSNYIAHESNMLMFEPGEQLYVNWSQTSGNILHAYVSSY